MQVPLTSSSELNIECVIQYALMSGDTGRGVSRAPRNHRVREREAGETRGHDGTNTEAIVRSTRALRKCCQEIRVLDERISEEEVGLLEKQAMEEPLNERRKSNVEG